MTLECCGTLRGVMGHRVSHDGSRQSVAQQQIGVVREPSKKVKKNQVTFVEDVHPKEIDASEHDGALRFWFRDHPGKLW